MVMATLKNYWKASRTQTYSKLTYHILINCMYIWAHVLPHLPYCII